VSDGIVLEAGGRRSTVLIGMASDRRNRSQHVFLQGDGFGLDRSLNVEGPETRTPDKSWR
jgi:hypothetical protein